MKKMYITLQMLLTVTIAFAQNWVNVGTPNLSTGTTLSAYLYFGDMEIDAAGNVCVGYWDYGGKLNFAKNTGGSTWTILSSPGVFAVSFLDIETHGTDYYISYMGARGTNYYAFTKKYDGSSAWNFAGDSILIGGIGQGGSFDFLLDKNGVPTIMGLTKTVFGDKTVKQFKAGTWVTTCVIPKSTSAIFKDGSGVYDANNNLFTITSGAIMLSSPPYSRSYATGLKISDSTVTPIGDSVFVNCSNGKYKMDASGNSYLLFNDGIKAVFLAYKLNSNKWDLIADTVGPVGSMLYADVSNDNKVVFSAQTFTYFQKSLFVYSGGNRSQMDSINYKGPAIGGISDIVIYNGFVYTLYNEGGYSVMKHSLSGSTTDVQNLAKGNAITIYPNPAINEITIDGSENRILEIALYDISGKLMLEMRSTENKFAVDVSYLNQGVYFIHTKTDSGIFVQKLLIQ